MNLRRVRLILTLFYGAVTALTVFGIALYAAQAGAERIYQSAERDAQGNVAEFAINRDDPSDNTWLVNTTDDWSSPQGETWVEPPLITLVDRANGRESFQRFEQDGTWLAYVRPIDDVNFAVNAVYLEDYETDVSSLRWRILLMAIGAVLAAAAAGWFVAGRALVPARRAAQQQRDFIADAAHEMRTPLAVIQASASHALSRSRESDAYVESLTEIRAATERAGAGVGELLELARLESGQAQPRKAPLRVDLLIEEVAAGIKIDDVAIDARPSRAVVVDADYSLLRQVVETLTRNAAARAPNVWLEVNSHAGDALIDVVDDGPGFDPDLLPEVFDRFRRGDTKGSSGLGMAIAKSVVDAHGGTIRAENRPEGGAIVRLTLRLGE